MQSQPIPLFRMDGIIDNRRNGTNNQNPAGWIGYSHHINQSGANTMQTCKYITKAFAYKSTRIAVLHVHTKKGWRPVQNHEARHQLCSWAERRIMACHGERQHVH